MSAAEPDDYGASYFAACRAAAAPRAPLSLDLDVDVCVVGAGLAGLTVALEVARRGWSVVVLESRRVAWNASSRNAGFVLPGYPADPRALIEKVGLSHARTLWALTEAGADYVRRTIREAEIADAELNESGWLHVSQTGNERKTAADAELLAREFGMAVEFWPGERVRAALRSKRYFHGLHLPGAFSINPLSYSLGLAAAAEAAGARIFEGTPALEIDPAGVRKRITTPSARVRAGHVVFAGNVHIDRLMPDLAATLVPVWAYSIVTQPLGERLREAITFKGAVTDNERGDSDHRVVGGDRLLWSARSTVRQRDPRRTARALAADIRRTYPQLGAVEAEHAWSGVIGVTVHHMPQIGELMPGVWLLSGFGGLGIATTAMGGELVARGIVDGSRTWELFQPFDLVWAGGRLGRAAVQTACWYGRASERVRGFLARRAHPVELPEPAPPPGPLDEPPAAAAEPPKRKRRRKAKPATESPVSAA